MVDAHGKVHKVKCKVCTKIDGKEKLLAPKLDNLWKHNGRRKALGTISRVFKVGEYDMNKDSVHVKVNVCIVQLRRTPLLTKFVMLLLVEGRKNWCNFLFVFTWWLKVDLWLIVKAWPSYYISLMWRIFPKPTSETHLVGRW